MTNQDSITGQKQQDSHGPKEEETKVKGCKQKSEPTGNLMKQHDG
jgi:hypothetical protein